VNMLNKPEKINQMGIRSRELGRTDAADVIVRTAEELVQRKKA